MAEPAYEIATVLLREGGFGWIVDEFEHQRQFELEVRREYDESVRSALDETGRPIFDQTSDEPPPPSRSKTGTDLATFVEVSLGEWVRLAINTRTEFDALARIRNVSLKESPQVTFASDDGLQFELTHESIATFESSISLILPALRQVVEIENRLNPGGPGYSL
jgi:hypothetical protein